MESWKQWYILHATIVLFACVNTRYFQSEGETWTQTRIRARARTKTRARDQNLAPIQALLNKTSFNFHLKRSSLESWRIKIKGSRIEASGWKWLKSLRNNNNNNIPTKEASLVFSLSLPPFCFLFQPRTLFSPPFKNGTTFKCKSLALC